LLSLVPFTRDGRTFAAVEHAAELLKQQTSGAESNDLESLLAVFASRTFPGDVVMETRMRILMSNEILESSPLYQTWVRDAAEKGREQGMRESVLAILRTRFDELPPELIAAVSSANRRVLEDLLPHVSTDSLDELRARLGV
jgi:hypothetical protein